MNHEWEKVRDFHIKFCHPYSDSPKKMDSVRARTRYNWMLEELDEFMDARDIVEQADAMIDLIYFALGTMVEMGIRPDELFQIVHTANMDKLWKDGKPHYAPDGKTIKPTGWQDPYMKLKLVIKGHSPSSGEGTF